MLKNKTVVITGANRGIGYETVKCCSLNGANIFAVVRNITEEILLKLRTVEEECGNTIKIFECDFSNEDSVKNCTSTILAEKIPLSGIANIAGVIGSQKAFETMSMKEIKNVFEVNFFAPLFFTQRLLKNLIRSRAGSIVSVSSAAAINGAPGGFEYCASKASLIGATKKLSRELGTFNIRVNAVAAGITDTDMSKFIDENNLQDSLKNTSLKRLAKPSEIAEAVVWLLSDKSGFITGQILRIDGGM